VQVERLVEDYSRNPKNIQIPGIYVDAVVISDKARHMQTFAEDFNPNYLRQGNIRELQNVIQRYLVLGNEEEIVSELGASGKKNGTPSEEGEGETAFISRQLALVCARLGITLIHARPYHAAGKGKQERWFRTLRMSLLPTLTDADLASLDALNHLWRCRKTQTEKPINPNLFTINCLTEWTFDGVTAFGEDHDNWAAASIRRLMNAPLSL
jgi:hypothetical protein